MNVINVHNKHVDVLNIFNIFPDILHSYLRYSGIYISYIGSTFQVVVKGNEWPPSSMYSAFNMGKERLHYCCICAQKCNALISMSEGEGLFRQLMLKLTLCLQITVSNWIFVRPFNSV
jgi:hypothetical protein